MGRRGKAVILAGELLVSADDPAPVLPQDFSFAVYPNPFNSSTTFDFSLPLVHGNVDLVIYNVLGEEVFRTALQPFGDKLTYHYDGRSFSGQSLPSGVYLLRASVAEFHQTQKIVILK